MKHEDERGVIEDLKVGPDWSVTYITFKKGAVRGNHYHENTEQIDIVLSGKLRFKATSLGGRYIVDDRIVNAGDVVQIISGQRHAYEALEDSEIVSTCKGVRVGDNYEDDTFRLDDKDKLL